VGSSNESDELKRLREENANLNAQLKPCLKEAR
jgi:hypothetical protein